MPLLWTAGVNSGRLTKEEFVAVTSANIARILNIYPRKGRIAIGSDADIVVWDPSAQKTIRAKSQLSRIDYNVFEGFSCGGAPVVTLSRARSPSPKAKCAPRRAMAAMSSGRLSRRSTSPIRPGSN